MNDNINLNGSVAVLFHNRLVCTTSCTYSKTDVRDQWSSHVGNSPELPNWPFEEAVVWQGLRVKRFGCKYWLYSLH